MLNKTQENSEKAINFEKQHIVSLHRYSIQEQNYENALRNQLILMIAYSVFIDTAQEAA
jgi:hypothetical protein